MEQKETANVHFANLDLLRFLAAFMVVFLHAYYGWIGPWGYPEVMSQTPDHRTLNKFGEYIHHVIENGMFGVDLFFLISGFLITYILLKEKGTTGSISIKNFFIRRGLRIWPLYFFIIAISPFIVNWLGKPKPDYQAVLLFYNNFHIIAIKDWGFPFAHFWSICIEEHFYLVWPFLIAFIPNKYLLHLFYTVIIASVFIRFGFSVTGKGFYELYLNTFSKMDILAIGAIGAHMHYTNTLRFMIPKYIRICLYILFFLIYSYESFVIYDRTFTACFRNYFYLGIAAIGMTNFLFNPDALIKIKKKTIFHYFGKISFGIYMYGNILSAVIVEKIMHPYNITSIYLYFFLNIALTLLVSIISYELFEKQFLKLKSRFEIIKTKR